MNYFVYLVRCADGTLYCGSTNNLEQRIKAHNYSKTGAKYTRTRRPVILVYSEQFDTKSLALKRESFIKNMDKQNKENLIPITNKHSLPLAK